MPGALLVAHQDVSNLARVHQGVVQGQDRPAGDAEDVGHPCRLQGMHQALRSGDLLAHQFLLRPCLLNEKPPDPAG